MENTLHNIFKPNNIKGEWFKFKSSILQEVILVMHNMCIKINKESDLYVEPIINVIKNQHTTVNAQGKTEYMCGKCKKNLKQSNHMIDILIEKQTVLNSS